MKKTNKENPITTFRKLNQARQGMVMKSLKKAQDGIETNDDLINKSGSKGNYKKPTSTMSDVYGQMVANKQYNDAKERLSDTLRDAYNTAVQKNKNKQNTDALNYLYPNYQINPSTYKQKKGGVNLSKKSLPKKGLGDSGVSNASNANVNYKSATFASSKKNPFTGRTRETVIEQTGPDQYTKKQNIINRKGEYIGSKSKPSNINQYSKYSNIGGGNTSLNNPITQSNKGFDFSSVANPERKKGGTIKKKMQDGGSSQQGVYRSYGAEQNRTRSGSTYGNSPQAKRGGTVKRKKK